MVWWCPAGVTVKQGTILWAVGEVWHCWLTSGSVLGSWTWGPGGPPLTAAAALAAVAFWRRVGDRLGEAFPLSGEPVGALKNTGNGFPPMGLPSISMDS